MIVSKNAYFPGCIECYASSPWVRNVSVPGCVDRGGGCGPVFPIAAPTGYGCSGVCGWTGSDLDGVGVVLWKASAGSWPVGASFLILDGVCSVGVGGGVSYGWVLSDVGSGGGCLRWSLIPYRIRLFIIIFTVLLHIFQLLFLYVNYNIYYTLIAFCYAWAMFYLCPVRFLKWLWFTCDLVFEWLYP